MCFQLPVFVVFGPCNQPTRAVYCVHSSQVSIARLPFKKKLVPNLFFSIYRLSDRTLFGSDSIGIKTTTKRRSKTHEPTSRCRVCARLYCTGRVKIVLTISQERGGGYSDWGPRSARWITCIDVAKDGKFCSVCVVCPQRIRLLTYIHTYFFLPSSPLV